MNGSRNVAVVTDSTADLPEASRVAAGIAVVPLDVRFGDETLRDGVDLSGDAFIARLAAAKEAPTTASPPAARFEDTFRALAADHAEIVALLVSAKLSGTIEAAKTAAAAVAAERPVEIAVVDSRTVSMALGFQALRAAELAATGLGVAAIVEALRAESARTHILFFVDTLEHLERGGRIGRAAALIGGVLQLKPLLRIDEGQVVPWDRARTHARAVDELVGFVAGLPAVERLAALYSSDREEGTALADRLAAVAGLPRERVVLAQIGPTVAAHIGPGALGVAVVEAAP